MPRSAFEASTLLGFNTRKVSYGTSAVLDRPLPAAALLVMRCSCSIDCLPGLPLYVRFSVQGNVMYFKTYDASSSACVQAWCLRISACVSHRSFVSTLWRPSNRMLLNRGPLQEPKVLRRDCLHAAPPCVLRCTVEKCNLLREGSRPQLVYGICLFIVASRHCLQLR